MARPLHGPSVSVCQLLEKMPSDSPADGKSYLLENIRFILFKKLERHSCPPLLVAGWYWRALSSFRIHFIPFMHLIRTLSARQSCIARHRRFVAVICAAIGVLFAFPRHNCHSYCLLNRQNVPLSPFFLLPFRPFYRHAVRSFVTHL